MTATLDPLRRETAPLDYQTALEQPNAEQRFDREFSKFVADCTHFEEGAKRFVYANPDAEQLHFRLHCAWLADLINRSQVLLVFAIKEKFSSPEIKQKIDFLEGKAKEYIFRMQDWHGAPGSHTDEPESFKRAMTEVADGNIIDFSP